MEKTLHPSSKTYQQHSKCGRKVYTRLFVCIYVLRYLHLLHLLFTAAALIVKKIRIITQPKTVVALVRYNLEYLFSPSNFGYIVQTCTFNT